MSVWIGLVLLTAVGWLWHKTRAARPVPLPPSGAYDFEIVGETSCQQALWDLAGGNTAEGVNVQAVAHLVVETTPSTAVRVDIAGRPVGYLSHSNAVRYRTQVNKTGTCAAVIRGGWQREREAGNFLVKLDLELK